MCFLDNISPSLPEGNVRVVHLGLFDLVFFLQKKEYSRGSVLLYGDPDQAGSRLLKDSSALRGRTKCDIKLRHDIRSAL